MSAVEGWPFIVARNATLDWRPILAPPFLVDAEADYLLVTETSAPGADLTQPRISMIESTKVGAITVAYRSVPATSELLGRTPAEPLLDRFGRPLHVVEGVVIRGAHRAPPGDLGSVVDRVRAETLRLMPAFWDEESETAPAARSQPMRIIVPGGEITALSEHERRALRSSNRWPPLPLAVALLVVIGATAWWWLRAN